MVNKLADFVTANQIGASVILTARRKKSTSLKPVSRRCEKSSAIIGHSQTRNSNEILTRSIC